MAKGSSPSEELRTPATTAYQAPQEKPKGEIWVNKMGGGSRNLFGNREGKISVLKTADAAVARVVLGYPKTSGSELMWISIRWI